MSIYVVGTRIFTKRNTSNVLVSPDWIRLNQIVQLLRSIAQEQSTFDSVRPDALNKAVDYLATHYGSFDSEQQNEIIAQIKSIQDSLDVIKTAILDDLQKAETLFASGNTDDINRNDFDLDAFEQRVQKYCQKYYDLKKQLETIRFECLVQNNPLFDFNTILVRQTNQPALVNNWLSPAIRPAGNDYHDAIIAFDPKKRNDSATIFFENDGKMIADLRLLWDANRFLYTSSVDNELQVFEYDFETKSSRQITPEPTRRCGLEIQPMISVHLKILPMKQLASSPLIMNGPPTVLALILIPIFPNGTCFSLAQKESTTTCLLLELAVLFNQTLGDCMIYWETLLNGPIPFIASILIIRLATFYTRKNVALSEEAPGAIVRWVRPRPFDVLINNGKKCSTSVFVSFAILLTFRQTT